MVSAKAVIQNETGLHLRPAGALCTEALKYPCKVNLKIREVTVNAKSVLGVLSACVKQGEEVEIVCDGEKEKEALNEIISLIENRFFERSNCI